MGLFPFSAHAQQMSCSIVPEALRYAESIRKLPLKHKIPCRVYSKAQVRAYIQQTIKEKLPQSRLSLEEYVYKALGLIPEDYEYGKGLVDLYLSQIGGFYEPEDEFFAMAGWMPSLLQMPIAVHELTHGIQDQYFSLEKFLDMEKMTTDELLARSALVEGDATAVMLDYARSLTGQKGIQNEEAVTSVMLQNVLGAGLSPGFSDAPESLRFFLLFPYTSGLRFAHALLKKDGYSEIDNTFKNPPGSTQEILHPEIYLSGGEGVHEVLVIDKEMRNEMKAPISIKHRDTLGEFALALLLRSLGVSHGDASKAASAWHGDRVFVYENKSGERSLEWRVKIKSTEKNTKILDVIFDYMNTGYEKKKLVATSINRTLEKNGDTIILKSSWD